MITPTTANSQEIWPCVLSIMTSYFTATTVDVLSQVDITPIAKTSQWTLFLTDQLYLPQRNASVDLVIITENLDEIQLAGTYGRVIAVTENLNSSLVLWLKKRLADTVVIYTNGSTINAYTWFPYKIPDCWTGVRCEFLATCFAGKWNEKHLYPNKAPENFKGCPVIYQTFPTAPDNIYDFVTETFSGGRELELMKILAKSMNLTMELLPMSWFFYWYPYEGSAMLNIETGEIDFAFAVLTLKDEFLLHAQCLPSHSNLPIVWMLPRARPKSNTTNIYSGFPWNMWVTIFIILILTGLIAGFMSWTENRRWNWLSLIAALLASPVYLHRSTTINAFIFLFQVYSLHIAWFYQSCLLGNLFKIPKDRQIQTPREAADLGLYAVLYSYQEMYFNHTEHEMWNKIYTPGFHNLTLDQSDFYSDLVHGGKTFSLSDLSRDGYALREKYKKNLNSMVLTIPFMNNPVMVYGIRGSPLTVLYTRRMGYAIQSGIFEHFSNSDRYNMDTHVIKESASAQVLTIEALGGAFMILGFFLAVALIVFIGEVFFHFGYKLCKKCYRSCKKILPDRKQRLVLNVNIK